MWTCPWPRAGQEQDQPTRLRGEAIARQTPCRPGQSCCPPQAQSVGKPRHVDVEGSQGMSDAAAQARIGSDRSCWIHGFGPERAGYRDVMAAD